MANVRSKSGTPIEDDFKSSDGTPIVIDITAQEAFAIDDANVIFQIGGAGGVAWGGISGTLSAQLDLQGELDLKADITSLATVATTGAYSDLSGTPSLAAVATSGAYSDLTGTPTAKRIVGMTFDGGGSPPTAGSVGYLVCGFTGVIDQWAIVADASGSAVVDVWKAAGSIPTNANTIAGTEKPTLSSQQLNNDTSLSTWTTPVTTGDVFAFELESVATCTRVTCEVRIAETL